MQKFATDAIMSSAQNMMQSHSRETRRYLMSIKLSWLHCFCVNQDVTKTCIIRYSRCDYELHKRGWTSMTSKVENKNHHFKSCLFVKIKRLLLLFFQKSCCTNVMIHVCPLYGSFIVAMITYTS